VRARSARLIRPTTVLLIVLAGASLTARLLGGMAVLLLLTMVGPYSISMVQVPGAELQNISPPTLALLELGAAPRGSDELARAVGADRHALYRVLRLLASVGVFAEVAPDSFALTPLGETLRSDSPGSVRNYAIMETAPGHWLPWGRLYESVRIGQPMARQALGMELFEWYAQSPEEAGYFNAAMGNLSALAASELVRVYDFSSVRTVADVGGAHGVLLTAVLRDNPAAHGILFDLPHVIATAGDSIAAAGLQERCQLVSGDFFEQGDRGRTRSPCSSPDQIARHIRDPADAQPTVR
jgi:hypothetical protein